MSEAANAPEGQMIDGRYRVVRKIAEGGMASVYQAQDTRLDRNVAIKVMHIQLAQGPHREQFVRRFRREATSAAAIANPHIVQVYDTGEYRGLAYLVMEYVHGINLRQEMNTHGCFSVRETLRIINETLNGLAAAHLAGVVHRDVKPENILINDRGHVQITDFGLAKAASQATLSSTGMLLGTAAYLAPEMIENNEATPQGDLYSVGIMAWEMLAGDIPFTSSNPVTLVFKHVHEDVPSIATQCPGISPEVAGFLSRLSARAIGDRPEDAVVALRELEQLSQHLDIQALSYQLQPDPTTLVDDGGDDTAVLSSDTPPAPPASGMNPDQGAEQTAETTPMQTPPHEEHFGTARLDEAPTQDLRTSQNVQSGGSSSHASPTQTLSETNGLANNGGAAKRSRTPLIIGLIVALVLLTAAGGGAWWHFWGPGSYWTMPRPTDLACPQTTGCTITDVGWVSYERTLKVAGIPYETTERYDDSIAKGRVISTDPSSVEARVSKRSGATVAVVVSLGVKQATVPEDILDAASANGKNPIDALKKAGFTAITHDESKDEYSLDLPAGAAASLSVQAGETMNHNATIAIQLSKGPMPVSMPGVVGRSKQDAQSAFDDAKLKASYTEQFSDTVASGTVISTSIDEGAQLHWGDAVDVVVSKGPQMVTIPDVRGQNEDDASKTLKALGLDVEISAPLGNLTHTVRLQSPGAGQQVRVRDTNGKATTITLTVV